jgi:hypothetical protein
MKLARKSTCLPGGAKEGAKASGRYSTMNLIGSGRRRLPGNSSWSKKIEFVSIS